MLLCYKTISSCCSCAYVEILSTWEVWRARKRLELHSAAPRATLTPLSCSPNSPRAQYLDIRTLTHELIVKYCNSQPRVFSRHLRYCKIKMKSWAVQLNPKSLRHTDINIPSKAVKLSKFKHHHLVVFIRRVN